MPKSWASASIPCSRKKPGPALGGIRHPLLADFWPHGGTAQAFGIFNEDAGTANRTVFIIDPEGVIRHSELHQGTLPDVPAILAKLAELQG